MRRLLLCLCCLAWLAACASAPPKPAAAPEMHRFVFQERTVLDEGTGLMWTRDASLAGRTSSGRLTTTSTASCRR